MMALMVNMRRNGKEPVSAEDFMLHKDEETEMATMEDFKRALQKARVG